MVRHTATPWVADPDDRPGYEWNVHIVEDAQPHMRIAFMSNGPNSEANAEFIVKAVNGHNALIDALSDTLNMLRAAHMQCGIHHDSNKRVIKAREVLANAKGDRTSPLSSHDGKTP